MRGAADLRVSTVRAGAERLDDRGVDCGRQKIKEYAGSRRMFEKGIQIVILDEADSMTMAAMMALRKIIERTSDNARFVLICNNVNRLIPALQSRCMARFRYRPMETEDVERQLESVCRLEGRAVSPEVLRSVAQSSEGDMRRLLNSLQTVFNMEEGDVSPETVSAVGGSRWRSTSTCSWRSRAAAQAPTRRCGRPAPLMKELRDRPPEHARGGLRRCPPVPGAGGGAGRGDQHAGPRRALRDCEAAARSPAVLLHAVVKALRRLRALGRRALGAPEKAAAETRSPEPTFLVPFGGQTPAHDDGGEGTAARRRGHTGSFVRQNLNCATTSA